MIVHIDCNSFYASCELVFRPDLRGKPVVVANCNETGGGIILALNKEAKNLGLKRGNPVFKVRSLLEQNSVAVFPANLQKYGDISRRIMQLVVEQDLVADFMQYSIDEFFGVIDAKDEDEVRKIVCDVKAMIEQCSGIPVSCGCSTTYTLAKAATYFAKQYSGYNGVCVLPENKRIVALNRLPIECVWGIGRSSQIKMQYHGVRTAFDFASKSEGWVRRLFSLSGNRTWNELRGIPAVDIAHEPQRRSILHSRTFAYMVSDFGQMSEFIAQYVTHAARKLREQGSVCTTITIFICTNRHREDLLQYQNSDMKRLVMPTADTAELLHTALMLLKRIWRDNYQYKKAGVILGEIMDDSAVQQDLFAQRDAYKSRKLMETIDSINQKYGTDFIRSALINSKPVDSDLKGFQAWKNQTLALQDVITIRAIDDNSVKKL